MSLLLTCCTYCLIWPFAVLVIAVIVVIAPAMKDNALFFGLFFGVVGFFSFYSTSLYEIKLLKALGKSDEEIEKEVNSVA